MRPDPRPESPAHDPDELLRQARELRERAYAPYSQLRVGAVLVTGAGRLFRGTNVENASFRLTTCAEQAAIAAMVSEGGRQTIREIAVVGDGPRPCTPCGACRQAILEFGPDATVYASGDAGRPLVASIRELLPHAFGPRHLAGGRARAER